MTNIERFPEYPGVNEAMSFVPDELAQTSRSGIRTILIGMYELNPSAFQDSLALARAESDVEDNPGYAPFYALVGRAGLSDPGLRNPSDDYLVGAVTAGQLSGLASLEVGGSPGQVILKHAAGLAYEHGQKTQEDFAQVA